MDSLLRSSARVLATLLLIPAASSQTTWFVDAAAAPPGLGTSANPFASIQLAIDQPATVNGDEIRVAAGTYFENIDFNGKHVTVQGFGAVIDAGGIGSAVTFQSGETAGAVLRGVTLRGGVGTMIGFDLRGGGAWIDSASPAFEAVTFSGSTADFGGGTAVLSGSPTFVDCTWSDNRATRGGGLHVENGSAVVIGGAFDNNRGHSVNSPGGGGGIWVAAQGDLRMESSELRANRAFPFLGGGAIGVDAASAGTLVRDSVFTRNSAGSFSGPGRGGAVLAHGPFLAENCWFLENGEPVEFDGHLFGGAGQGGEYVDCAFEGNGAQLGGALSGAEATRCSFVRNFGCADGSGRGGATNGCTLTECTLRNNWACGEGGGASNSTLVDCDVVYNYATGSHSSAPALGGGLWSCTATETRIKGNEARPYGGSGASLPSEGGGVFGTDLDRCIVTGNFAEVGGGVASPSFSSAVIDQSTVVGNHALVESAGVSGGTYRNSIVWHNIGGPSLGSATFSYSNVEAGALGVGNISATPMVFGPAGSDVHLMAGSACIDAGDPTFPRDPDGTRADMGALPFDPAWAAGASPFCRPTRPFGGDCLPLIGSQGTASLSGVSTMTVTATGIPPGRLGMLFVSLAPDAFFVPNTTFSDGTICLGMPLVRVRAQTSTSSPSNSCGGTFAESLTPSDLTNFGLAPGDRLLAQFWFRQTAGFALTNALEIPILP